MVGSGGVRKHSVSCREISAEASPSRADEGSRELFLQVFSKNQEEKDATDDLGAIGDASVVCGREATGIDSVVVAGVVGSVAVDLGLKVALKLLQSSLMPFFSFFSGVSIVSIDGHECRA